MLRVGFQSQKQTITVAATGTTTADFTMKVAVAQLQEVVTTATGQQRKVELGERHFDTGRRRQARRAGADLDGVGHAHRTGARRHVPAGDGSSGLRRRSASAASRRSA